MSDLEDLFGDHHADWFTVACEQGEAFVPVQMASRQRLAHFLHPLTERTALPGGSSEVTLQLHGLGTELFQPPFRSGGHGS